MAVTEKRGLVPIATQVNRVPPAEAARLASLQRKAEKK